MFGRSKSKSKPNDHANGATTHDAVTASDARSLDFMQSLMRLSRADDWANQYTGLGDASRDPAMSTYFMGRPRIDQRTAEALYAQNAIAAKIVDRPAFDATREWIELTPDNEAQGGAADDLLEEHERIKSRQALRKSMSWARLYGGSLAILGVNDGQTDVSQPLNENAITAFTRIEVIDRWQVRPGPISMDPESPWFGEPETYTLYPLVPMGYGSAASSSYRSGTVIHASRVLRFDGIEVPARLKIETMGFGWSVLDRILSEVRDWGSSHRYLVGTMKEATIDVFKLGNLASLLERGQIDKLRERMSLIALCKSVLGGVFIGENEAFEKRSVDVSGYANLLREFKEVVAAAADMPMTLLFATSPGGLNATGESDTRNYYDSVASHQEDVLKSHVQRLNHLLAVNKGGPIRTPINVKTTFKPLWQLSETQQSEVYSRNAAADVAYIDAGVLRPHEVALSRFGGRNGAIQIAEELRNEEAELAEAGESPEPDDGEDDDGEKDMPSPMPAPKKKPEPDAEE